MIDIHIGSYFGHVTKSASSTGGAHFSLNLNSWRSQRASSKTIVFPPNLVAALTNLLDVKTTDVIY